MKYEAFLELMDSKIEDDLIEYEEYMRICKESDIHCECCSSIEGDDVSKMVVVLLGDKFYANFAERGVDYGYWMTWDNFHEVTEDDIEEEIRKVEVFYNELKGIRRFSDKNYKNKIMLQDVFKVKK